MSKHVRDNINDLDAAMEEVKSHCMCLSFVDDGARYMAIYPEGYYPQGIRVSYGMGKTTALMKMIEIMERHWIESLPGAEK